MGSRWRRKFWCPPFMVMCSLVLLQWPQDLDIHILHQFAWFLQSPIKNSPCHQFSLVIIPRAAPCLSNPASPGLAIERSHIRTEVNYYNRGWISFSFPAPYSRHIIVAGEQGCSASTASKRTKSQFGLLRGTPGISDGIKKSCIVTYLVQ